MNDSNMEALIRSMFNEGKDAESIAKAISDTMNKIQTEREKESAEQKEKEKVRKLQKHIEDSFIIAFEQGRINPKEAAKLCYLTVKDSYPDWEDRQINLFLEVMEESIKDTAAAVSIDFDSELMKTISNTSGAINDAITKFRDLFLSCSKSTEPSSDSNNSNKKNSSLTAAKEPTTKPYGFDTQVIAEFLRRHSL